MDHALQNLSQRLFLPAERHTTYVQEEQPQTVDPSLSYSCLFPKSKTERKNR